MSSIGRRLLNALPQPNSGPQVSAQRHEPVSLFLPIKDQVFFAPTNRILQSFSLKSNFYPFRVFSRGRGLLVETETELQKVLENRKETPHQPRFSADRTRYVLRSWGKRQKSRARIPKNLPEKAESLDSLGQMEDYMRSKFDCVKGMNRIFVTQ